METDGHVDDESRLRAGDCRGTSQQLLQRPGVEVPHHRRLDRRLAGLWGCHQGSSPRMLTPRLEAKILSWTRRAPTNGTTHWSTRRLALTLGLSCQRQ